MITFKAKEVWDQIVKSREVYSFEELVEIFKIEKDTLKDILDSLVKEGYLIKGERFREKDCVYLPIDVNDEYLDKIRVVEIKGDVHLVAIWKLKEGWKVSNMYLGKWNKIIKEGLGKAVEILNSKNKVIYETYG